jgi:predicted transcriptional regulator
MTYVLDGRRVAVRDLLDAGLLSTGETLTFDRARVGLRHTAVVEQGGSLLVDGRSYTTPSRAAATAAGMAAVDGWTAWVTERGQTLHRLRAALLDDVAGAQREAGIATETERTAATGSVEPSGDEIFDSLVPRHEFLKKAREAAEEGKPLVVSVRTLLGQWGVNAREHRVSRHIEADLDNHALLTRPNFLKVSLDDDVTLVAVQPELSMAEPQLESAAPGVAPSVTSDPVTPETNAHAEIGLTLGNVMSSARKLVFVKPTATFAEAMTLMLMNDYSQLPVLQNKYKCVGAVTWRSIAYAQMKDASAPFSAAIVKKVTVESYDRDLHHLLPVIQAEDFVVVTDDLNVVSGIVTTADVVGLYGERTLPFLLIGELDQELRQVMSNIDIDVIRAVCPSTTGDAVKSHDDMTMGQYQQVLANPECWAMIGWALDRSAFIARLDELRRIRNDVMHFNPDGVPDDTVDHLRHMLALIREFGSSGET